MAQAPDVKKIQEGFQSLRAYPAAKIHVDMQVLRGQETTTSSMDISWVWDPTGQSDSALLRSNELAGDTLTKQLLGDGSTLYTYDAATDRVSSAGYGTTENFSARMNLLNALYGNSSRKGTYAAKLLQQVYGGNDAHYVPWARGEVTYLTAEDGDAQDPISGETYSPSATRDYIAYETEGVLSRSVVFQRDQVIGADNQPRWIVSAIYYTKYDVSHPENPNGYEIVLTIDPKQETPDLSDFTYNARSESTSPTQHTPQRSE